MNRRLPIPYFILFVCLSPLASFAQNAAASKLEKEFLHPPASAKPWVFWYWMQAAVSKPGITADLEAMKQAGIGGAYLMPIKDTSAAIPFQPQVRQLTPAWWAMVKFAMQEAKRLNLQLAMHVSDGFALAGGPWITPEMSMQKLVWTKSYVKGNTGKEETLDQPEAVAGYYKDIAVFAYPANCKQPFSDTFLIPNVTTSTGAKANFLSYAGDDKESFKSDTACWIQYKYPELFTCRSIRIHIGGNNFQAERLMIQACNDGMHFKTITRLEPPRHGWEDNDEDYTYSIPAVTAKYFRFVYNKEGTEPGAEDLDAAKWKPSLKINGIYLSDEPVINQYEGKNGSVWRIATNTTVQEVPAKDAVPLKDIISLTDKMDSSGKLHWIVPAGKWIIVRIGHTSNGHTNATGGGGKGLECDKFDPVAVKFQFDNWFGKAFEKIDRALANKVLKIFHVDSWECGSQNWSAVFAKEFEKRRGYDLMPYLLVMAGVPLQDAATSEKILHDVRETIAELINDNFYVTLKKLAHDKGCNFTAESVAPTMLSDGMLHYKTADIPMGEFWLNSPTHDKPNDMLDAISGGHVYGKPLIQAESFTSVRMNWSENPSSLKTAGDRNFALGINKMVLHVFAHNPWMNRRPGMTLDGVGVYFQRDQIWWKQGKAWIDYLQRCQYLLQQGQPVADVAVFTGEELPRRSLLPDRLVNTMPGIFGNEKVQQEIKRLKNEGEPLRQKPDGVTNAANMADPENWVNPLNGYAYDSFNPDVLLTATVKDGRIELPGGASYALLVIPYKHAMQPNTGYMSVPVAKKIQQLVKDGATVLMSTDYGQVDNMLDNEAQLKTIMQDLAKDDPVRKGRIISIPYTAASFKDLNIEKDADIAEQANTIAWTHRHSATEDIYFIANQKDVLQQVNVSFRITGKEPELWNAVTGEITKANDWHIENGRTRMALTLDKNASIFVVFRNAAKAKEQHDKKAEISGKLALNNNWKLQFDTAYGGPAAPVKYESLKSWSDDADKRIKYYSGAVVYSNSFEWKETTGTKKIWLSIGDVANIATIKINGKDCGTLWTPPYRVDISNAIKPGNNTIAIEVANTWANRLTGDNLLPEKERITWTTAPFRLKDKPLLKAGILGEVKLEW